MYIKQHSFSVTFLPYKHFSSRVHIHTHTKYKDTNTSVGKTYERMCKYRYEADMASLKRNVLTCNVLK